jgi:hypothetical protein
MPFLGLKEGHVFEVILKALIYSFYLPIYLWVIGSSKVQFDSEVFEQILTKYACENYVYVS